MKFLVVTNDCGNHSGGSVRWRSNHATAGGILFIHGKSEECHPIHLFERIGRLHIAQLAKDFGRAASNPKTARQLTTAATARLDTLLIAAAPQFIDLRLDFTPKSDSLIHS